MRTRFLILLFLFGTVIIKAQELYPNTQPASSVPKGALGVRVYDKSYQDITILRTLNVLNLMYGLTSKLSIYGSISMSNHHSINFPANLAFHTHNGSQSVFGSGSITRGLQYPTIYNGVNLYAKYRFLTLDGDSRHFRMAAYGEWSNINVAHDEAEPNLLDDTKGIGAGLIATGLIKHFAATLSSGIILPGKYNGFSPDIYGGPMVPTQLQYGRALTYNLSLGYLLYPAHYADYKQLNVNVYVEFMGKAYEQAKIIQYGIVDVPIQTPLLKAGYYLDVTPGVQAIINSNLRIDFSTGFQCINKSYAHFYPVYMFGIQRYFYFKNKKK